MRRRLYFLLPNVNTAKQVFNELLLARIDDQHIHALAREGTSLGDVPEATLLQKSDTMHGVILGLLVGGMTGALAGVVTVLFPPSGLAMGFGVILALSVLGACVGLWASGLIAMNVPNTRLQSFAKAVDEGKILMIVDIPKTQVDDVADMVKKHHPQADMRGLEPGMPAFP
ncbi:MAG: DUF1269 domain-containing protein [Gammaproteobacteria bacterium]|nr:DUF1269 domain-containing protein [Gammaproteobacteria bacterium]